MGIAAEVHSSALGRKLRLISQPVRLSRTPARLATASPARGEHNDEVLQEAGFSASEIEVFRKEKII